MVYILLYVPYFCLPAPAGAVAAGAAAVAAALAVRSCGALALFPTSNLYPIGTPMLLYMV